MINPIAPTHEPAVLLAATSSRADVVSENSVPSALAPFSTSSAEPGGLQPNTIVGIVLGLVGFVALILVCSFISKLPCFRPSRPPPTVPRQRRQSQSVHLRTPLDPVASDMGIGLGTDHYPVCYPTNERRLMSRPPGHTEARVAFATPSVHTAPPSYCNCALDPLPHRGPNPLLDPPPYSEPLRPRCSSEYSHAPQKALLET